MFSLLRRCAKGSTLWLPISRFPTRGSRRWSAHWLQRGGASALHRFQTGESERDTLVVTFAPDLASFEATLARLATDAGFSGAVAVTRGDQQLFAAAYGYANRAWQAPCTLKTRFDTASVTKLFTAVATLQLVERGAFSLETSVIGHLELEGTTISPTVTPYHLLTHTSGIADDADEEAGERYEDLWVSRTTR